MKHSPLVRLPLAVALGLSLATPALADGPISVYAGPQFIAQGTAQNLAGTVQVDAAAGYDFGPKTIVPVRARFDLDDGFGNTNNGRVGYFGVGASARLTTPVYAGVGFSIYSVNVHVSPVVTPGFSQGVAAGTTIPNGSSANGTGFGTNIFVGQKILSVPGIGLAIEGSYKRIPSLDGVNPSAFGIGLRASI
jgi:hypothetical protein